LLIYHSSEAIVKRFFVVQMVVLFYQPMSSVFIRNLLDLQSTFVGRRSMRLYEQTISGY